MIEEKLKKGKKVCESDIYDVERFTYLYALLEIYINPKASLESDWNIPFSRK